VRKGDYFSTIAGKYSTTVENLVALNEWLQREASSYHLLYTCAKHACKQVEAVLGCLLFLSSASWRFGLICCQRLTYESDSMYRL
jgi:hypothetical protein